MTCHCGAMEQTLPKLSSYTLPWPTDWATIFGIERPLILEIGFGMGQMLAYLHQHYPDHNIIGLEISNFCLESAEKAILRDEMSNVRVLHSRAETALHHLFTPASLRQIHVNFPDPWFKDRHAGRRLMQRDTLDAMVNRLKPGGMFYLATDIIAYAEMSHALLAATPGLTNQLESAWVNAYPHRAETKYERKARKQGRDRYYFVYQRNDIAAPAVPVIKEVEMPHIVMKTPLDLNAMYDGIHIDVDGTMIYNTDNAHINLLNKYRSDKALLFELYIREPTIDQHLALMLSPRNDKPDEYTLRVSSLGTPRPTDAIHKAVGAVGELLVGLHPDSKVVQNKIRGD